MKNQFSECLIDNSPQQLTLNYYQLQPPLIPVPIHGLDVLSDIYCVGLQPIERWRSYIDATDWDPKQYHDKLMGKRAYHARIVWEMFTFKSFTDFTWLSTTSLNLLAETALLEMRSIEIEIISYQLTCGMIGIKCDDHRDLYRCSLEFYTLVLWLTEKVLGKKKTKSQYQTLGEVKRDMQPILSMSKKELGKSIDKLVYAVQEFMKRAEIMVDKENEREIFMKELSLKLQKAIISFDKVANVM